MYLKKLIYENMGPLREVVLDFSFENNQPKPIIFVGENGSGKSILLSNIVDAFYTIASKEYNNVLMKSEHLSGGSYYKTLSSLQISEGCDYLFSCISFTYESKSFDYLFRFGTDNQSYIENKYKINGLSKIWGKKHSSKGTNVTSEEVESIFSKNIMMFFPPTRYEKPSWLGEKYFQNDYPFSFTTKESLTGVLENEIYVYNILEKNINWLLNVIADSRIDILSHDGNGLHARDIDDVRTASFLSKARNNIEIILSKILAKDIYLSLNSRNYTIKRLCIKDKTDNKILVPSLNSLSSGQLALFNMFSTIIRHADTNDIKQSVDLKDISGIVVIDEIELHLHSSLQRDTLPQLIKLFPKVQFIITSHSPLFLLGMEQEFGSDDFEVYQLPTGEKIGVEAFSEFEKAYEYLTLTQKYQSEVKNAINAKTSKMLIVTEGSTDWKHLKAAYSNLKDNPEHQELFKNLEFDFLEYEPPSDENESSIKLHMGDTTLSTMCDSFSKLPQHRKIVFLADNDKPDITRKLSSSESGDYKYWGNDVFSLVLPVPTHRTSTPLICIEHLYSDAEIKTMIKCEDGKHRRLYMGNEFDSDGISQNCMCKNRNICGENKIAIIEGSDKERVRPLTMNSKENLALPKMKFAEAILQKDIEVSFDNFIPIFEKIKKIQNDN